LSFHKFSADSGDEAGAVFQESGDVFREGSKAGGDIGATAAGPVKAVVTCYDTVISIAWYCNE